jgi:hypothetical protein
MVSFQACLDNVEAKTGKTPQEFVDLAKAEGLTRHSQIVEWLKADFGLGTGHVPAIAHVILQRSEFEVKHTTGPHRDASGTLDLGGRKNREARAAAPVATAPADVSAGNRRRPLRPSSGRSVSVDRP